MYEQIPVKIKKFIISQEENGSLQCYYTDNKGQMARHSI